ncbi:myosin light chain kinase 2, skeletal/cardiac muscle-like [Littorina saxatilis]|uniref:myosin light chain kinase 2, skeletal/cardiac muscle-like n=1 Tax=Littorina saxatilis TaxID=31220 RepID=UPI0038B56294
MAAKRPSTLKCRGGREEGNAAIIHMMTLTSANPVEAVRDALGTTYKGSMLGSSSRDNQAQRALNLASSASPEHGDIDLSSRAPYQTSQGQLEIEYRLEVDGGTHNDSEEQRTMGKLTAESLQRSTQPRPVHAPERVLRRGPEVDPSCQVVARSQKRFSSVQLDSRQLASSHTQQESCREESVIENIKTPSQSSVIPVMNKLLSSSDKSPGSEASGTTSSSEHSDSTDSDNQKLADAEKHNPSDKSPGSEASGTTSSSEHSDSTDSDNQKLADAVDAPVVRRTFSCLQESLQGFLFGPSKELEDYLVKIVSTPRDFGIYIHDQFYPSLVEGVMRYREGKEFTVKKIIHHSENKSCGVFLCADNRTKNQFVLKKIKMRNRRLIGIEFLTQHNKAFLPKIYGVYKERDFIHIFEEFIEGGTLLTCDWNLAQVRQFAETLLSSVHYLHIHDLAHFDLKIPNLMVRDRADPESLVLIDFESAKHPQYAFQKGGYTVFYLPPWFDTLLDLNLYHPVLKTADLWAIACVIIYFLLPHDRSDVQARNRGVWNQAMEDIKNECKTCTESAKHSRQICDDCKRDVMLHIKSNGHRILDIHLGHLMDSNIDDPDWLALRQVLQYLTDTRNIKEMNIEIALSMVKGPVERKSITAVKCSSNL